MVTVNEGSRVNITAKLRDFDGDAITPTTVRYRVDCKTTGTALIGWTDLTPSASLSVTVPATASAIQNNCNRFELKAITFEANAGLPSAFTTEQRWKVTNLEFIT